RIPAIGDGHNRYQLLDVLDLVDAVVLGLTVPEELANDTFNIGAERFGTVREDLGALCARAESGARVIGTPAWPVKAILATAERLKLSPLYKWVYGTADKESYVGIEKAKARLGWQPRFSNAEALIHAYDWYLANKDKLPSGSGVTHRIGWDQGILGLFKKLS
ncbi:MAG: NAD(P)-dependent oxidoreductase, partial [Thermoanaerobaculia bacterium]